MEAKGTRRRAQRGRYLKRVGESGADSGELKDLPTEDLPPTDRTGQQEKRNSKNVRLITWFTANEMKCLGEVCRVRDCRPEQLVRELVLCELAQHRAIGKL